MTDRDALHEEMRRLLLGELGKGPLALDEDTAERLLAGRLDPGDAPPGYAGVARVLAAAAAPATARELDGEASARAAFNAVTRGPSQAAREPVTYRRRTRSRRPDPTPRRRVPWVRDRLPESAVKARRRLGTRLVMVAAALAVLLVGGVAAAATGTLPEPARRVVDSVSRRILAPPSHRVLAPPSHTVDRQPPKADRPSSSTVQQPPPSAGQQPDRGKARSSGHDQRPSASGGHAANGQDGHGKHKVKAAPTGPSDPGSARRGLCGASLAGRGSACDKADHPNRPARARASSFALDHGPKAKPTGKSRANGNRQEEGG